jgi:uncharacterized OB-fold protein/acyl dehydratase
MVAADVADDVATRIRAEAERIMALGESSPRSARDPVNLPIIENWVEAIGDANPVYTDAEFAAASVHGGLVSPPAMMQVWTMPGQRQVGDGTDPMSQIVGVLEDAGYTSVVATNSDHVFHRYVRHGESLDLRVSLVGLIGPKKTALGEGWFFTTRNTWYSGDEAVATMDFRILKFRPPSAGNGSIPADSGGTPLSSGQQQGAPAAPGGSGQARPAAAPAADGGASGGVVMRPVVSADTAFFWEGMAVGELRIQRCGDCGALRHPPGPACLECGLLNPQYTVAAGTGEIFSYVVHHHPPVPGKKLPLVIALVRLDEGVRLLGEMVGVSPEQVSVGMPVRIEFLRVDDDLTLPAWRPAVAAPAPATGSGELPEMSVEVTATFVVASALATRDFTPVHHDRDLAHANGSKDIFLNILTDTGLVQRFVSQWAGPQSLLRSISLRLGVPCYARDRLTFSGRVAEHTAADDADRYEVSVTGRCSLGDHVIASAVVDIPRSQA